MYCHSRQRRHVMNYDASIYKQLETEFTGGIYVITYTVFALFFLAGFLVRLLIF